MLQIAKHTNDIKRARRKRHSRIN